MSIMDKMMSQCSKMMHQNMPDEKRADCIPKHGNDMDGSGLCRNVRRREAEFCGKGIQKKLLMGSQLQKELNYAK